MSIVDTLLQLSSGLLIGLGIFFIVFYLGIITITPRILPNVPYGLGVFSGLVCMIAGFAIYYKVKDR